MAVERGLEVLPGRRTPFGIHAQLKPNDSQGKLKIHIEACISLFCMKQQNTPTKSVGHTVDLLSLAGHPLC